MGARKRPMPKFENEQDESEFWDSHSILDCVEEPQLEEVHLRTPKDRPITIRLDSGSRAGLQELASAYHVGPSTMARMILVQAIERWAANKQISMTLEDALEAMFARVSEEAKEEVLQFMESSAIGDDPKNPSFLIMSSEGLRELSKRIFRELFEASGISIISPEDSEYNALRNKIDSETFVPRRRASPPIVRHPSSDQDIDSESANERPVKSSP